MDPTSGSTSRSSGRRPPGVAPGAQVARPVMRSRSKPRIAAVSGTFESVHLAAPVGRHPLPRAGHGLVDRMVLRVGQLRTVVVVLAPRSPRTSSRPARSSGRSGARRGPACLLACCDGEESQQPMWPHCAHRRRCTHQPPAASHSTQPVPLRRARPGRCLRSVMTTPPAIGGVAGSRDPEAGVAGHRLDRQVAVVLVDDDPPRDVQAQAGALADRLGGEERLEDPSTIVVGDARAGVADLDLDAVVDRDWCGWSACPSPPIACTALSIRFVHTWFSSAA